MDIYEILFNLIQKPKAYKYYKLMQKYYESKNLDNESKAFGYLIEKRFTKKNEIIVNDSDINQK